MVGAVLECPCAAAHHLAAVDLGYELGQRLLGLSVGAVEGAGLRGYLPVRASRPRLTTSFHLRHLPLGFPFSICTMEPSPVCAAVTSTSPATRSCARGTL